ncbi:hypothetical protein FQR65_LT05213 [Abscondita terminalis]|nr:hypothetical protein FQR65_LT05213 [Abscondita terminalis]
MKVDLDTLLKQAQDMQSKMQSAQAELAQIVVTGEAGGGMVKVEMDGRHTVKSIWLDPASLKEPKEFVEELLFCCLPGVGPKSAQRMVFHLLERARADGAALAKIIEQAIQEVGNCEQCRSLSETPICTLCSSPNRDTSLLCVVETPVDVLAIEQTASYRGYYFVLMGRLSPLDGIGPEELALAPTPRLGFEMMLLRLLAFKPGIEQTEYHLAKSIQPIVTEKKPNAAPKVEQAIELKQQKNLHWPTFIKQLNLTGLTYALAQQCALQSYQDNHFSLRLDPKQAALHSVKQEAKLAQVLSDYFKQPITLTITLGDADLSTPARLEQQYKSQRLEQTAAALQEDPTIQAIMQTFDAKLQPESIQLLDED